MDFDENKLDKFQSYICKIADDLAISAGYGGRMDDGGSQQLRDQVRFYNMGRGGVLPTEWINYKKDFEKTIDVEYDEYVRLKKKFE